MKRTTLVLVIAAAIGMYSPETRSDEPTRAKLNPQLEKVFAAYGQAKYKEAGELIAKVIEADPQDVTALCVRVLNSMADPDVPAWKTMTAVNDTLDVDPDSLYALAQKAILLRGFGQKDASDALLKKIHERQPREGNWLDQFGLFLVCRQESNEKGTLVAINEALRLVPDSPALSSTVLIYRGVTYANRYDYEKAEVDYNAALARNPRSVFAVGNLASVRLSQSDNAGAIKNATAALQMNPEYVDALETRTVAYTRQRDYKPALADINAAVKLQPKTARLVLKRAQVRLAMGDKVGAKNDAEKAEALDLSGPIGKQARELMTSLE